MAGFDLQGALKNTVNWAQGAASGKWVEPAVKEVQEHVTTPVQQQVITPVQQQATKYLEGYNRPVSQQPIIALPKIQPVETNIIPAIRKVADLPLPSNPITTPIRVYNEVERIMTLQKQPLIQLPQPSTQQKPIAPIDAFIRATPAFGPSIIASYLSPTQKQEVSDTISKIVTGKPQQGAYTYEPTPLEKLSQVTRDVRTEPQIRKDEINRVQLETKIEPFKTKIFGVDVGPGVTAGYVKDILTPSPLQNAARRTQIQSEEREKYIAQLNKLEPQLKDVSPEYVSSANAAQKYIETRIDPLKPRLETKIKNINAYIPIVDSALATVKANPTQQNYNNYAKVASKYDEMVSDYNIDKKTYDNAVSEYETQYKPRFESAKSKYDPINTQYEDIYKQYEKSDTATLSALDKQQQLERKDRETSIFAPIIPYTEAATKTIMTGYSRDQFTKDVTRAKQNATTPLDKAVLEYGTMFPGAGLAVLSSIGADKGVEGWKKRIESGIYDTPKMAAYNTKDKDIIGKLSGGVAGLWGEESATSPIGPGAVLKAGPSTAALAPLGLTALFGQMLPAAEYVARHPRYAAVIAPGIAQQVVTAQVDIFKNKPIEEGLPFLASFAAPELYNPLFLTKASPVRLAFEKIPTGATYTGLRGGKIGASVGSAYRKIQGVEIPGAGVMESQLTWGQKVARLGEMVTKPVEVPVTSLIFDPLPMLTGSGRKLPVLGKASDVRYIASVAQKAEGSTWLNPKYNMDMLKPEVKGVKYDRNTGAKIEYIEKPAVMAVDMSSPYRPADINWATPSTLVQPRSPSSIKAINDIKWWLNEKSPVSVSTGAPVQLAQVIEKSGYVPMAHDAPVGTTLMLKSLEKRAGLEIAATKPKVTTTTNPATLTSEVSYKTTTTPGTPIGNDVQKALKYYKAILDETDRAARGWRPERINDPYIEAKKLSGGGIPKTHEEEFLNLMREIDPKAYLTGTTAIAFQSYYRRTQIPEVDIISDNHVALAKTYGDYYSKYYPRDAGMPENVQVKYTGPDSSEVWTRKVIKIVDNKPEYGTKFVKRLDIHSQKYGMGWEEFGVKHSYRDVIEVNGVRMMPLDALVARKLSTILAYAPSEVNGELLIGAKEGKWKNMADVQAILESRITAARERPGSTLGLNWGTNREMARIEQTKTLLSDAISEASPLSKAGKAEALKRFYYVPKTTEVGAIQELSNYKYDYAHGEYRKSLVPEFLIGHKRYVEKGSSAPEKVVSGAKKVAGVALAASPIQLSWGEIAKGAAYDTEKTAMPEFGIFGGRIRERSTLSGTQLSYRNPVVGVRSYLTENFGITGKNAELPFEGNVPILTRVKKVKTEPLSNPKFGDTEPTGASVVDLMARKHPTETKTETVLGVDVTTAAKMPPRDATRAVGIMPSESWTWLSNKEGAHYIDNVLQADRGGAIAVAKEILTGATKQEAVLGEVAKGMPTIGYSPLGKGLSLEEKGRVVKDQTHIVVPLLTKYAKSVSENALDQLKILAKDHGINLKSRSLDRDIVNLKAKSPNQAATMESLLMHSRMYDALQAEKSAMRGIVKGQEVALRDLREVLKHVDSVPIGSEADIIKWANKHNLRAQGAMTNVAFQRFGLQKTGDMDWAALTQTTADKSVPELMDIYRKYSQKGQVMDQTGKMVTADYFKSNTGKTYIIKRYVDQPLAMDKTIELTDVTINPKTGKPTPEAPGTAVEKAFSVHVQAFGEDLTWGLRSAVNPAKPRDIILNGVRVQSLSEQLMNTITTNMYFSYDELGNLYLGAKPIKSPRYGKVAGDVIGDLIDRRNRLVESGGATSKLEIAQIDKFITDVESYALSPNHPTIKIYQSPGVPTSSGMVFGNSIEGYGKRLTKYPEPVKSHAIPSTKVKVPGTPFTITVGSKVGEFFSKYSDPIGTIATVAAIGIAAPYVAPYVSGALQQVGVSKDDQNNVGNWILGFGLVAGQLRSSTKKTFTTRTALSASDEILGKAIYATKNQVSRELPYSPLEYKYERSIPTGRTLMGGGYTQSATPTKTQKYVQNGYTKSKEQAYAPNYKRSVVYSVLDATPKYNQNVKYPEQKYNKTPTYPKNNVYTQPDYEKVAKYVEPKYTKVPAYPITSVYAEVTGYPEPTPYTEPAKYVKTSKVIDYNPAVPVYPYVGLPSTPPKYPKPVIEPPKYPKTIIEIEPPRYPKMPGVTIPPKQVIPIIPLQEETPKKKKKRKIVTPSHYEYAPGSEPEDVISFIFGVSSGKKKKPNKKDIPNSMLSSGMFKKK